MNKILKIFLKTLLKTLLFFVFCYIFMIIFPENISKSDVMQEMIQTPKIIKTELIAIKPKKLKLEWTKPDMDKIKRYGCVADGLLSEYNEPQIDIEIAKNSKCYYFHRALETWLSPPDFRKAKKTIKEIGKIDAQYGMFIAEAINTKSKYYYREKHRMFKFKDMCKRGSKNFWGEHTCKPSMDKPEYRAYLRQITRDAMDIGIKVFVFGQVKYQEKDWKKHPKVDNVIREMKEYASDIGMEILVGAQTGDITKKGYLEFFDFIEGGVGLHTDGTTEEGPCYSKFYKIQGDWCWPLMWHDKFKSKAKNVLIYLDWNGEIGDDMNTFARLDTNKRHEVLKYLHEKLTNQNIGFLLPLITPLPIDDASCHGPKKKFYSPSMQHGCPDFDTINEILSK